MKVFAHHESFPGDSLQRIYCESLLKGVEIAVFAANPGTGGYTIINTESDGFILVFADYGSPVQVQFDDQEVVPDKAGALSILYYGKEKHRLSFHGIKAGTSLVTVFIPEPWLNGFLGNGRYSEALTGRMQHVNTPVYYASCREQAILLNRLSGYRTGGAADKAMLQGYLLRLLEVYFCSNHSVTGQEKKNGGPLNKDDMELIRTAEEYILQEFCSDKFTVQLLVRRTAANYNRLNLLFKNKYGMKVSEYIRFRRIEKSREMMAGSNKSISEIAYEIGYSSISNYILAFKKVHQITPGHYKRNIA